jgi:penicillin-insensitive murein endopeptidase
MCTAPLSALLLSAIVYVIAMSPASASTCYGTPAHGRLQDGVPLPSTGPNYTPYSSLGVTLGRTYVHATVRDIVVDAYTATYRAMPGKRFMYGETGLATGGPFKPHRTHQAGTSVDFMVPVVDEQHRSALLPASALNKFGYDLEFDAQGVSGKLHIDFDALAEHLYQLAESAKNHGTPIERVIFQKELVARLYQTRRGDYLRRSVTFMKATPWIKHDEHYHVDFALRCKPLTNGTK